MTSYFASPLTGDEYLQPAARCTSQIDGATMSPTVTLPGQCGGLGSNQFHLPHLSYRNIFMHSLFFHCK